MSTGAFFFFTLEQDGQTSGGAMSPSLKSGGATAPPPVPPPMVRIVEKESFSTILHEPRKWAQTKTRSVICFFLIGLFHNQNNQKVITFW